MIFCKRCGNYAADGLADCPKCSANLFDSGEPTLVTGAIRPATPFPAPSGTGSSAEPAGHGPRILAWLMDSLLAGLIVAVGGGVSWAVQGVVGLLIVFACIFVAIAYEPYFIATQGATPGKKAMGLRVVDKDGAQISPGKSIARYLLKSILGGLLWIVGLFTDRRQCLHDLIVGTYVVQA